MLALAFCLLAVCTGTCHVRSGLAFPLRWKALVGFRRFLCSGPRWDANIFSFEEEEKSPSSFQERRRGMPSSWCILARISVASTSGEARRASIGALTVAAEAWKRQVASWSTCTCGLDREWCILYGTWPRNARIRAPAVTPRIIAGIGTTLVGTHPSAVGSFRLQPIVAI